MTRDLTAYETEAIQRARTARLLLELYEASAGNDKDRLIKALATARPLVDGWRRQIDYAAEIAARRQQERSEEEQRAALVRDLPAGSGDCMAETRAPGNWPRWYPCGKAARYRVPANIDGKTRLKHVCGAHKNVWLRRGSIIWSKET